MKEIIVKIILLVVALVIVKPIFLRKIEDVGKNIGSSATKRAQESLKKK